MAGIRIEFAQFGDFDTFDILRSDTPMDIGSLPSPLVTGLTTMYYVDTSVVDGATYYYRARVWRDGVGSVSSELMSIAATYADNFDSNTLSNYTGYADTAANWAISGGYLTASSGSQAILTRKVVSVTDVELRAVILDAEDTGLVLRLLSNSTYYVLVIHDGSAKFNKNTINLYSRVGGSYTLLASSAVPTFNRGTATTLSFSAIGSSLVAKVNGTTYISITNSAITSAGKVGVRMNASGSHKFDSFIII